MIKACAHKACYNFIRVVRNRKYCSARCRSIQSKTNWRGKNKERYRKSEADRQRRRYHTEPAYREYKLKHANERYAGLTIEQKKRHGRRSFNKERHRNYMRMRYQKDLDFRLRNALRSRIRQAIIRDSGEKSIKTADLIGCSVKELKQHLEAQFADGMSWDNYGEWHIDHIIPCASFDLTDEQEQRECFHYTNLQPLWGVDNIKKGDKVV